MKLNNIHQMIKKRTTRTDIWLLRRLLLLLLMVGVESVWGQTVYFEQDYEKNGAVADWTTSVSERFTPIIMTEGENHFLAGNPAQTYNNGATLTGPDLGVAAETDFVMSFDLRLGNSNNNKPEFYIKDAGGGKFFSITPKYANGDHPWIINGSTEVTLDGTQYINRADLMIDDNNYRPWHRFKFVHKNGVTTLTITNLSTSTVVFNNIISELSTTGGLGRMMYLSAKSLAKFAIDNVLVTDLFSYTSAEAEVNITSVGTTNRPAITGLPTIVNETGTSSITYNSSDRNVALIDETGKVYLTGTGTTTITATAGSYSTSYELTVYGDDAIISTNTTTDGTNKTMSWSIDSEGILESGKDIYLGGLTMTYGLSTETAIAINDNNTYVLKIVDKNGWSHPYLNGHVPHDIDYGGTYYKIATTKAGTLNVIGRLNNPVLYTSTGEAVSCSVNGNTLTVNLESEKTYFLYNTSETYGMLHSISYTYENPAVEWTSNAVTIDIMDVKSTNPNVVTGLPTLKNDNNYSITYETEDHAVAIFAASSYSAIHILGPGTTKVKATARINESTTYTASYLLTVTGGSVTPTLTNNTLTFADEGVLYKSSDVLSAGKEMFSIGGLVDVTCGFQGETAIITNDGMGTVLKMIDSNGYSHANLWAAENNPIPNIPAENSTGGTFIRLDTKDSDGYLIVTGNVSTERTVIYKYNTTRLDGILLTADDNGLVYNGNTMSVSLEKNKTYYLYNKRLESDETNNTYVPLVHSITFVKGFFQDASQVISLDEKSTYTIQEVKGITSPIYSIDGAGDVGSTLGIDASKHITGIVGGGAIKIKAQDPNDETSTASYVLTVAYPASSEKFWDFNPAGSSMTTSDGLKVKPVPKNPAPTAATATNINGDTWTAFWKNANEGFLRGEEWGCDDAVDGNNAFLISETAGLVFNTVERGFYLRNDDDSYKNIGIRKYGASFTIPRLKAGDIVELNWKHEAGGSGTLFTATNLKDLRGKPVDEEFQITESAQRTKDNHVGRYSFIATGGDVTFTLKDNGNTDILSVRIYEGPYRSTMRNVNLQGNVSAPTTLLLDDVLNGYTYNYCNQLYSTATGPAFYVLKGYRSGKDKIESVKGVTAGRGAVDDLENGYYTDDDPNYPAYPVSDEEKEQLYEQRKNLIDFRMYNVSWKSANNSYNNGRIEATSGWGKVTIRMNNYTNDMKYVIGYTPDYTLTIGSAPHQKYPYTWDFTNISSQMEANKPTNVYHTSLSDEINWENTNGVFSLNTDNAGQSGSQYVPGAVLVTANKALSKYTVNNVSNYALDELDGLGFNGKIAFRTGETSASAKTGTPSTLTIGELLYCETSTTITIPDLNADGKQDWIYVSASAAPSLVTNEGTELAPVDDENDGPDANAANQVYKYKVANEGDAYLTFDAGTEIYKIGVTHILKEIFPIAGKGWATESRDHAIDHTLTGYFTVNDVNAYTVKTSSNSERQAMVGLTSINEGGYVPKETGVVLKLEDANTTGGSNFNKANNKTTGDGQKHWYVPLFYPSYTTPQTTTSVDFPTNNLMMANLDERVLAKETETGEIDKNGDKIDDSGVDDGLYTRFILAKRYMTWKKDAALHKPTAFESRDVAVFYRLHSYDSSELGTMELSDDDNTADKLNTLDANKAYLLLPTSDLPQALWDDTSSDAPRRYIAIEGVSDMEEIEMMEESEQENRGDGRIYNIGGQVMSADENVLPPGIYIRNGKKFVVK